MRGIFIALEGIDGAGKTAQAEPVAEHLSKVYRRPALHASDSKAGEWGKRARAWARGELELEPEQVLEAFVRDRAELSHGIAAALQRGYVVVCDRWEHSSWAYSLASGLSSICIRHWVRRHPLAAHPDVVLWLDAPVEVALERVNRAAIARLRPEIRQRYETAEFLTRVAARYGLMPELVRVDASLPEREVTRHLIHAVLLAFEHQTPPRELRAQRGGSA